MPEKRLIAFQGELGAYSDLAARALFPRHETLPCPTFDDALAAVRNRKAEYAVIPIDNLIAGRVADIHHLLPRSNLHIIGEHFQPIEHRLLGVKGAKLGDTREARSHVHALAQCRAFLKEHKIKPHVVEDTAGGAREIAELGNPGIAAVASSLAGELYGLKELARNIEDSPGNTTRFVIFAREADIPAFDSKPVITSLFFKLRSVPSALYKAIGGFATNGINLLKLESYVGEGFQTAEFYAEAEAHPNDIRMQHALDELRFFSEEVRLIGTYPSHSYRRTAKTKKR